MHSGNLGLFVSAAGLRRGVFDLAPVDDMLSMRGRPDAALGGAPGYTPFEPDAASARSAAADSARGFWGAPAAWKDVSQGPRAIARTMVDKV